MKINFVFTMLANHKKLCPLVRKALSSIVEEPKKFYNKYL